MLELRNVSKSYGTGKREKNVCYALSDVSFRVEAGEQIAVVGKSGSGKSTLLHMIGGMDMPDEGEILLDGRLLPASERKRSVYRRREIGFIFQFFYLVSSLTVYDNIVLPLHLNHMPISRKKVFDMAEQLGIGDKLKAYPSQLSGGQQQRVAIARAVIHEPKLILADEPTGNLDSESSRQVMELLTSLWRGRDQSMLLVTHDEEVSAMFSRKIEISDGRVISDSGAH